MRVKLMINHKDSPPDDEPVILSLEAARQSDVRPDDNPPEPADSNVPETDEAFWAGRNLAMRRSARWAA